MSVKDFFVGKKALQPLFERMFRLSLRGMNYGLGGMIDSSGEKNVMELVERQLAERGLDPKIIFDVGANHGQYTDELLKIFRGRVRVFCFEPSGVSYKELKARHGNNPLVELVPLGLGATNEKRKLYFDIEGSGWASVFQRKDTGFNHPLENSEEINLISLDEFCKSNDISRIHFVKADVEGFELSVLQGAKDMLPNIDFIQFEFSFANYNSKTYLFDFFEILADFRIYRILRNGIEEIQYDPRYEILMTSNYLAINKKFSV
jgi:FkbM family methyltransferase